MPRHRYSARRHFFISDMIKSWQYFDLKSCRGKTSKVSQDFNEFVLYLGYFKRFGSNLNCLSIFCFLLYVLKMCDSRRIVESSVNWEYSSSPNFIEWSLSIIQMCNLCKFSCTFFTETQCCSIVWIFWFDKIQSESWQSKMWLLIILAFGNITASHKCHVCIFTPPTSRGAMK